MDLIVEYFLLLFQLPNQLRDAFISAVDNGSIKSMPNRSMPASPHPTPGALLLGDAFNMRHPLTGGGMTVALSDIALLSNLLKPLHDLHDAAALCKYLESFYTLRKVSHILYIHWIYLKDSTNAEVKLDFTLFYYDWFHLLCFCSQYHLRLTH